MKFGPFGGACTPVEMALLNDRRDLAMVVHEPYYRLGLRRMLDAHAENRRRLDAELGLCFLCPRKPV